MKRLLLILSLSFIGQNGFSQSYKDKQVLTFSDSTKSKVLIKELQVFNKATKSFQPFEISFTDFYNYKKNPLGIRYFNFGCIKTKRSAYWDGQIGKDKFGHAIFKSPIDGIKTMILLTTDMIENRGKNTLYKFFNTYAPSNDCVGSIKNKDGSCKYGYNAPEKYAKKVGDKLNLKIKDRLSIRDAKGQYNTKLLSALLSEVARFETGLNCKFEEDTMIKAIELLD